MLRALLALALVCGSAVADDTDAAAGLVAATYTGVKRVPILPRGVNIRTTSPWPPALASVSALCPCAVRRKISSSVACRTSRMTT